MPALGCPRGRSRSTTGTWSLPPSTSRVELAVERSELKFYEVNPFDVPGAEQTCQTIASSHPFVVLDVGALSSDFCE